MTSNNPFHPEYEPPEWSPMQPAEFKPMTDEQINSIAAHSGASTADVRAFIDEQRKTSRVFLNAFYQAVITPMRGNGADGWFHLSIKRIDQQPVHDWRDLQQIKNDLFGVDREAVELYPRESRVVDTANQYHLWVAPPGYMFPFGFNDGRIVADADGDGVGGNAPWRQRPRNQEKQS